MTSEMRNSCIRISAYVAAYSMWCADNTILFMGSYVPAIAFAVGWVATTFMREVYI